MDLRRKGRQDDLFLQVARDESGLSGTDEEGKEPPTFRERIRSRAEKRRSLPADIVHSPLDFANQRTDDFAYSESPQETSFQPRAPQHMGRYSTSRLRSPSVASYNPRAETLSGGPGRSRSGHLPRYSIQNDHSPVSPSRLAAHTRSPELSHNARRRPSVGAISPQRQKERQHHLLPLESASESPPDSSEPKQSNGDTESVPSQTAASTVWDELDDLKSRIKKLELTGKWPPSSNATTSFERPRTATTAPTTIDSSPKHDRKAESREQTPTNKEESVSAQDIANTHPLLHNALAKARPLLNPSLYRSLEATANDALQLSVISAGTVSQSSTATAVGGAAVVDRQLRRKANAMCRNLTDLCLALCDGKHETPSVAASPVLLDRPSRQPSIAHQRSNLGSGAVVVLPDGYRPASRLDARRTSLGLQPLGADGGLYRRSREDVSTSEEETTPAKTTYALDQGSIERPASRLLGIRKQAYGDFSGDEEVGMRPPSRAMTDVGTLRKGHGRRDYEVNGQERSPTLREALISRRVNAAAREGNQTLPRVSSMNSEISRRRYFDRSTPPVLEEGEIELPPQNRSRRRITSLGANQSVHRVMEEPHRTMSLSQKHDFIAE
ncbi:hypothetical protein K431DRAFT_236286 [Polychaeton citri CBS 116435]|uniref:Uncharacterized protein n=1 Tax=Polychaeton citri CBS 116435 TaxID=1314669 RepID=A0A9P4Q0B6_9PEZI|nr:hypothetical protein K431DRAFT_236286 [Polychaeton citri CBS 116435]